MWVGRGRLERCHRSVENGENFLFFGGFCCPSEGCCLQPGRSGTESYDTTNMRSSEYHVTWAGTCWQTFQTRT